MENSADAPIVCFCCNRAITEGSRYVLVNRLHRIRKANTEDEIVYGMASLQICSFCATRTREEEIVLNETPLPLLKVEMEGFYSFVRNLGLSSKPHMRKGNADKCSFCGTSITDGKDYIEIEVHMEEIKNGHPEVVADSIRVLAIACSECAQTYMIWL